MDGDVDVTNDFLGRVANMQYASSGLVSPLHDWIHRKCSSFTMIRFTKEASHSNIYFGSYGVSGAGYSFRQDAASSFEAG